MRKSASPRLLSPLRPLDLDVAAAVHQHGLEVQRHDDRAVGRGGLHLVDEGGRLGQRLVLRRAEGQALVVPVRGDDQRRLAEAAFLSMDILFILLNSI